MPAPMRRAPKSTPPPAGCVNKRIGLVGYDCACASLAAVPLNINTKQVAHRKTYRISPPLEKLCAAALEPDALFEWQPRAPPWPTRNILRRYRARRYALPAKRRRAASSPDLSC